MKFERNIIRKLKEWAGRSNRKPLILRGARQVGKTTVVNMFSNEFDHYIPLNLEKNLDRSFFTDYDSLATTIEALFFQYEISKGTGKVLIFIDEIQYEPKAVSLLRYFYEDFPEIYVIAAGSLLETLIEANISFPVGRVEYLVMRPVSFSEFLNAMGEGKALEIVRQVPLPDYAFSKLLSLFHTYALIGGMPEIVQTYVESRDLNLLKPIYISLLTTYLDDVQKYAKKAVNVPVLRHCIEHVFKEGGKRIKFEGFGGATFKSLEIKGALKILEKAMLIHLVYPTSEVQIPATPNMRKSPYLQVLDTGLLNFFSGIQATLLGTKDLNDSFKGRIAEHWVGQQLLAKMTSPLDSLSFWARDKNQSSAEVDFIFPFESKLIPVEVKAGATGRLRSLFQFMNRAPHSLAIRMYASKVHLQKATTIAGEPFDLLNLPYFLGEFLNEYLVWMEEELDFTADR